MARRASFHGHSGGSPRTVTSPRFDRRRRSSSLEFRTWQSPVQTSLGLQISDLTMLLNDVIPRFSEDKELIHLSRNHCKRIIVAENWSGDELEDIISVLNSFIDTSPMLPPSLVGSVHSTIGLIRQRQRFHECAIESLQKALWIKNSAREQPEEIGMALHRLGLAYLRQGERSEACCLLQKALVKYEEANWGKYHPFVHSARIKVERYLQPTSPASPVKTTRRASSSPARRRPDLRSMVNDWSSLPAMPVLR